MNNKKFDGALYEGPYVETLKEIIENTVAKSPERVAYMYKDTHKEPFREITYKEFDKQRRALGTALLGMGLKGSKIAVAGENSHRWALSYFTVVSGVGTIVPIDKNLQLLEIENLLRRADVELLFISHKMVDTVLSCLDTVETLKYLVILDPPETDLNRYLEDSRVMLLSQLLEKGKRSLREGHHEYEDAVVAADDLSTILFTSGTTGLAKGVMLSHRNLAQNVFNMSKYFHIPDGGRVLSILPIHHAYEMTCTIMTCFYQGATVVICEGLKHIQTNFKEARCSVMLGVPLVYENMHRKIMKQAEKSGILPKLQRAIAMSRKLNLQNHPKATRKMFDSIHKLFGKDHYMFIAGGAAIDPAVIEDFEAMGFSMLQGYGMTECAPIIAMNTDRYRKAAAAGKPMPGSEVRIVDEDENGIGEVIVKGPSVMMGYYKDPENTAKTIKDGWLYSGDYGYFDDEGFLYITGRKKNVIVTKGGKNIFPEEVEYYMLLDERIQEVIVYGKYDEAKDDLICTAIVYPDYELLKSQGITEDVDVYKVLRQITDEANEKMPPYKRVKRIEVRDKAFVKTTTLKIKRFEDENYEYKFDDRSIHSGRGGNRV